MALYDRSGKEITTGAELSSSDIKTALVGAVADGTVNLGSVVGATLSYTSPSEAWETNAETTYQNLLTAYKNVPNSSIPFFVSTDQHGRGMEQHRWLNNRDSDGLNIININLGDSVMDVYNAETMNGILARTKQIKNFCGVVGNHDCKYGAEEVSQYVLSNCFTSTKDKRMIENQRVCYSFLDNVHNTKFIVVEPYDTAGITSGMPHPYISPVVAEWLIGEMSVKDGYDIVICIHEPCYKTSKTRTDSEETTYSNEKEKLSLWDLLLARKNKASGTYTDDSGESHSYDFANMESDLLCTLHGHTHEELYSVADGLTGYACDWYGNNNCCTFGLIDRENNLLRIFKFDSTAVYDVLEIPI